MRTTGMGTPITQYCLALVAMLLLASGAFAQSTTNGAIGGTVTDQSGAVVPNAGVSTKNVSTGANASGTSDEGGRFLLIHLQPGVYSLEVSTSGFSAFKATNIIVEVGRTTTIDVTLGVQAQIETIVATAEAPVITTDRADFSTNINSTTIENLPINGRRWSTFALSTPGAVPDGNFGLVSFRGVSGLLNNNTVDGGDNNQAFFAEEKGRTRISYSISESSIREFQVNTSNYSAEYGRSAGGVVNAVTKSGTNRMHGEAFWFYRSTDFGAINPFAFLTTLQNGTAVTTPVKPEDKRHQFGGDIAGPIIKDKLFFFFSADQQKRNFPGIANASAPAAFFAPLSAAELTTLNGRGVSTAQANAGLAFLQSLTGVVPRTGDELLLFPKIDWNLNPKHHLSMEFNRMRWASPAGIQTAGVVFRGKESFGNDFVKDDTAIARLVSTISSTMTNELRFQYGRDFEFENTQPAIAGEPVSGQGISPQITISGSAGIVFGKPNFLDRRSYPDERSYQVADTYSIGHGKHLFKFGGDVVRFHDVLDNLFQESGAYSYSLRQDFISDYAAAVNSFPTHACGTAPNKVACYSSFVQDFGTPRFEFRTIDYGFFFQDDWRIAQRLTLNLGLRWEYEQMPDPQIPNSNLPATAGAPTYPNVAAPGGTTNPPDVVVFAANTPNPMIHQFDFVFEHQIANNTAVSASYIGSLGRYLPIFVDTNLSPPTGTITYTFVNGPNNGQTITVQPFTSSNNVLNPFDLALENGRSNFDIRHHFGSTLVWQPKFFQQRRGYVKTALDGWTIAPVVSVSSGAPYTSSISGTLPAATGRVQSGILGAGGTSRLPTLPRNGFQMPRIANVDLRIAKKFNVWESTGLELFGEAFNLFNHVNVTTVGTRNYSMTGTAAAPTLTFDPQFGIPTGSTTSTGTLTQRQIQIGARLTF